MATDTVQIDVVVAPSFFSALASEAARLDRSLSWVLRTCIRKALPDIAGVVAGSPAHTALRKTAQRPGASKKTFFLPSDLHEACSREATRLELTSGELLTWAFERARTSA